MKRMEVRCCCTPNKLLGTLPVQDARGVGDEICFVAMKPRVLTFESTTKFTAVIGDRITLKIVSAEEGVALIASGVTIEKLRLIPGFIEATP